MVYARFSSERQREESIDAQVREIKKFAKENDLEIVRIYSDHALSATTDDRPEFLKMISEVKALDVSYAIVHKLDRFSRSRYDSAIYKKKLKDAGVTLISVSERLDGSPESIMLESLIEGMAEYYSANLSREVGKGMRENAYNCKFNGGIRPYGFKIDEDKNFVIDDFEASAIKFIFTAYAGGATLKEICKKINEDGHRTVLGKEFTPSSLERTLSNEKYIGTYSTTIKGETIRIENGIPAIVKKLDFDRVQELRKCKGFRGSKRARNSYLLTGLAVHDCGASLQGQTALSHTGRTYMYYYCPKCEKRFRVDYVDSVMLKSTERLFKDEENKAKLVNSIYDYFQKGSNFGVIKNLNKAIKDTENQINNLADAVATSGANKTLLQKLIYTENLKRDLENKLKNEKLNYKPYDREYIEKIVLKYGDLTSYGNKELKPLLRFLISEIKIAPNLLSITFNALKGSRTKGIGGPSPSSSEILVLNVHLAA